MKEGKENRKQWKKNRKGKEKKIRKNNVIEMKDIMFRKGERELDDRKQRE